VVKRKSIEILTQTRIIYILLSTLLQQKLN